MPDVAALLAQLTSRPEPASDPTQAALKLVRATVDALVLRMGQSIDAKITAQLPGGLTQLTAGGESFVLKLETPLPVNTAVTLKIAPGPSGQPSVTVTVPAPAASTPPPAAQPLPRPATAAPPLPQGQHGQQMVSTPSPSGPVSQPPSAAVQSTPAAPPPAPALATQAAPTASQPAAQQLPLQPGQPVATLPAATPAPAAPVPQTAAPIANAPPAPALATPAGPEHAPATSNTPVPPTLVPSSQPGPSPSAPIPTPTAPQPAAAPPPSQQTAVPTAPAVPARPAAAPPLVLTDPAQAAARQDSAAPLLAKISTLVAATPSALPRPVFEAAIRLLAARLDLNRTPPDGRALKEAVLRSGVLTEPGAKTLPTAKDALLQLRALLAPLASASVAAAPQVIRRPPPPLHGEAPRSPQPQGQSAPSGEPPQETARQLLGHTDAALSRLKLLQLASTPADLRPGAPAAPASEFRVEIPLLLGAETGILQLLVERDGSRKQRERQERGWRMRFALNFTATGEVGADIALLGRTANVALWAAEPETADALEAMLPELTPALASHGLDVAGIRVRRGLPATPARTPGQLLDSAR